MRTIERSRQFRRDYRREKSGVHGKKLDDLLGDILVLLIEDKPLPHNAVDHALIGSLNDCRDCHVKPDLFQIYRKKDDSILELLRLGSHSELGL